MSHDMSSHSTQDAIEAAFARLPRQSTPSIAEADINSITSYENDDVDERGRTLSRPVSVPGNSRDASGAMPKYTTPQKPDGEVVATLHLHDLHTKAQRLVIADVNCLASYNLVAGAGHSKVIVPGM